MPECASGSRLLVVVVFLVIIFCHYEGISKLKRRRIRESSICRTRREGPLVLSKSFVLLVGISQIFLLDNYVGLSTLGVTDFILFFLQLTPISDYVSRSVYQPLYPINNSCTTSASCGSV